MTIEQKYISFDGKIYCREDLCLKHEREVIDQGVFFFDQYGKMLDITPYNFDGYAKLLYIKEGAEQSFNDLGYRNWIGGYALKFAEGWYVKDPNDGWINCNDKVRMFNNAQAIVDERLWKQYESRRNEEGS